MGVSVKWIRHEVSMPQLMFFRAWVNFLVTLLWMKLLSEPLIPKSGLKILFLRGTLGTCALFCYLYGITVLPLPIAMVINATTPVFVAIFSKIFLNESLSRKTVPYFAAAMIGFLLVALSGNSASMPGADGGEPKAVTFTAMLITLLGAMFAAGAFITMRVLTQKVSVLTVILYFTGLATLYSFPFVLREWVPLTQKSLGFLLLVGCFATVGQFGLTQAYRFVRAPIASAMGLSVIGFAALFGWLIFNEWISPLQWVGVVLLVTSVCLMALVKVE